MAAAVAALCGLVLACSDPKAGPLPTPSVTTVSPTSASPTAPPDYEAEVRAAITAYFDALNAALRDPANRTDELAALIAPSCTCTQILDALRAEAREGRYVDYTYSVTDVRVQQAGALGGSVTYTAHQTKGHERTHDGRIVQTFAASTTKYSAHFQRDGTVWRLDRLDQVR